MDTTAPPEKFAYSVADAALASGVGRSQIYDAVADGSLPARKRGTSTLILVGDLKAWLSSLPSWKPSHGRVEAAARARDGHVAARRAKAEAHQAEAHQVVARTSRREAAARRAKAQEARAAG